MNWVPHFFSHYDCLLYCPTYGSCPFLSPSRQIMMWLYIVPYLYIKTKHLHSLPLPKSFHFDLFGKRIKAIIKTSWRISDGCGFRFPLFIVILCLYERPVLNGLWIRGGKSSSNFTTSPFLTFKNLSHIFFLMFDLICSLAIVCI